MKFFHVYILQSQIDSDAFYVGFTEDLRDRLETHNAGHVPHTAKFRPWKVKRLLLSVIASGLLNLNFI